MFSSVSEASYHLRTNRMSVLKVSYYYLITVLLGSSRLLCDRAELSSQKNLFTVLVLTVLVLSSYYLVTVLLCSSRLLLCVRAELSSQSNLVNVLVLSSYYLVTISCLSWKCLITISFLSQKCLITILSQSYFALPHFSSVSEVRCHLRTILLLSQYSLVTIL